ncbi:hypothetical protein CRE_12963 [Caenorhabditis remanei]|uniref:GH18 domain-containing protein n=1 Tax=Caenorhabditis remanei TaxID=31234 RepID=E3N104_CAERE|nr:hypothetical protein CRE_12963 [Caenorhabditis remanei]
MKRKNSELKTMPSSATTLEPLTSGQGNVRRVRSRNRNSTSRTKHLLKKLKYGVLIFLFCGLLAHLLTTIVMPLIENYFSKEHSKILQLQNQWFLCSNLVPIELLVSMMDPETGISLKLVKKARQLNPELKVMFSIGGYIDYVNFPSVSASPEYRKNLAKSIKLFIQHHMVDGVDICWKWPTKFENRDTYVLMLEEIRAALASISKPLLLTIVSPSYD